MATATPRTDALLARLRASLRRSTWLYGVGTVLAAAAGWLLLSYLLDRLLHVPAPIRVLHTLVLIGLPLWLLIRHLVKPLSGTPDRAGLAVLADRAANAGDDLFVSAVQLNLRPEGPGTPLVSRVVAEAESRADRVELSPVLEASKPRRRAGLAFGVVALSVGALAAQPAMAGIYFSRMLGGGSNWPQRTNLSVEIPLAEERGQVIVGEDEILVRAARGTDVPVLVRAEGVAPPEVLLQFESGHETALTAGGGDLYRTVLRSVQQDLSFRAVGGDDNDGEPRVRLEVLQPPDVAGLAYRVTPPSYTGREPALLRTTDIEILEGSTVTVHVLPDPLDSVGHAQLFPLDQRVALEPTPFPVDGGEASSTGLAFELTPEDSLRFSVELVDAGGLPNPDPGLFGITVREDRRPDLTLLSPTRAELDVVLGGAVPLRVRVEDDHGVGLVRWDARAPEDIDVTLTEGELTTRSAEGVDEARLSGRIVEVAVARLDVLAIGQGTELVEGSQLQLQVYATDNRAPEPGTSQSAPVRLRIVSGDEYLRGLKDDLARAGQRATELATQITAAESELNDLLGSLGDGGPATTGAAELAFGARRIAGDGRSLGRELAGLAEGLLYSRLDERGGALLESLDAALARSAERGFQPAPWSRLSEDYSAGRLGTAELSGNLVELVGLALSISERHAAEMAETLENAPASDPGPAIAQARDSAERARVAVDELVTRLAEWDNFQSVLTLTKDLLNRQRNLIERTKQFAEDN